MKDTQKTALTGGVIGAAVAVFLVLGMLALAPLQTSETTSTPSATDFPCSRSTNWNGRPRPGQLPGERSQSTAVPGPGFGGRTARPSAAPTPSR
jgi:hypothetical protein